MTATGVPPPTPSVRIAAEIRARISSGTLRPGDRVPSTRDIKREWGVAMATATRALALLREEGAVVSRPGVGMLVASHDVRPHTGPSTSPRREREQDPDLTLAKVVQAAIQIADAEGLPVLSMRRVSGALDIATMTLYRFVPSKYQLVVMMADSVFAEWPPPEPPPDGWRACLELIARRHWAMYEMHPWLAQVISFTRPEPTPHALPHTEWTFRALEGLGLDATMLLFMTVTLFSYVRGTAVNLDSEAEAVRDTGLTDEEWMQTQEARMQAITLSGEFPVFARVVQQDIDFTLKSLFEMGLQLMLDGMAARLPSG